MTERTDHVLDAIDRAVHDWSVSSDAMRMVPTREHADRAGITPSGDRRRPRPPVPRRRVGPSTHAAPITIHLAPDTLAAIQRSLVTAADTNRDATAAFRGVSLMFTFTDEHAGAFRRIGEAAAEAGEVLTARLAQVTKVVQRAFPPPSDPSEGMSVRERALYLQQHRSDHLAPVAEVKFRRRGR